MENGTWVPIETLHDDEAWDDSALIRAYDSAIDAYQVLACHLHSNTRSGPHQGAPATAGDARAHSRRTREDGVPAAQAVRFLALHRAARKVMLA